MVTEAWVRLVLTLDTLVTWAPTVPRSPRSTSAVLLVRLTFDAFVQKGWFAVRPTLSTLPNLADVP